MNSDNDNDGIDMKRDSMNIQQILKSKSELQKLVDAKGKGIAWLVGCATRNIFDEIIDEEVKQLIYEIYYNYDYGKSYHIYSTPDSGKMADDEFSQETPSISNDNSCPALYNIKYILEDVRDNVIGELEFEEVEKVISEEVYDSFMAIQEISNNDDIKNKCNQQELGNINEENNNISEHENSRQHIYKEIENANMHEENNSGVGININDSIVNTSEEKECKNKFNPTIDTEIQVNNNIKIKDSNDGIIQKRATKNIKEKRVTKNEYKLTFEEELNNLYKNLGKINILNIEDNEEMLIVSGKGKEYKENEYKHATCKTTNNMSVNPIHIKQTELIRCVNFRESIIKENPLNNVKTNMNAGSRINSKRKIESIIDYVTINQPPSNTRIQQNQQKINTNDTEVIKFPDCKKRNGDQMLSNQDHVDNM